MEQCRIFWFEILFWGGAGVTWQGAAVLVGGGLLSGGMRIAPQEFFLENWLADSGTGLGAGSLQVGGVGRQKVVLVSSVQGFWCIKIQPL